MVHIVGAGTGTLTPAFTGVIYLVHRREALANLCTSLEKLSRMLGSGEIRSILARSVRTGREDVLPQQRLTDNEAGELAASYRSGATVSELAERFDLNRETAANQLKRSGVAMRNVIREDKIKQALQLLDAGISANEVGRRLSRPEDDSQAPHGKDARLGVSKWRY